MTLGRVRSSLFVGRIHELSFFKTFLHPDSPVNTLNISSNGDGGIGKTRLLAEMMQYCEREPDTILFTTKLIDFYHANSHSRLGVMQQIMENLDPDDKAFLTFRQGFQEYSATDDQVRRQQLFPELQEAFAENFCDFVNSESLPDKRIVVFFDTYEVIQGDEIEIEGRKDAKTTDFSEWLEEEFFPKLFSAPNVRLVVSGRYPLRDRARNSLKWIDLAHFDRSETLEFWMKCFAVDSPKKLIQIFGTEANLETLYLLSDGRPILLALFADWVNYERNPLSPEELLKEIERETGSVNTSVTPQQKIFFEQILIERIAQLVAPEDRAVTYMAVAYHRMTPEILHSLIGAPEHKCESILTSLRSLSFIKPKEQHIILLHDEMRRMILQHWWNIQDPDKSIRRDIAKRLVWFYQETLDSLLGGEREIFQSELLGYIFLEDFHKGVIYFEGEVDKARDDGRNNQADLLLREAEAYVQENRTEISPADVLRIEAKRVEYLVDVERNYENARTSAQHVLQRYYELPEWEQSGLPGQFLLHQGVAELNQLRFDKAIGTLKLAKNEFYESGEDILMNEATNWIGLVFYRQSQFHEAQRSWESSFGGFSSLIEAKESVEKDRRTLTQDIRYSLANLALLFGYQGKFAKAVQYAEIALDIVRSLASNDREIARMRILVSEMLALAGRRMDARHQAEQAQKLIEARELEDPMWVGRLYMTLCWLRYRNNEFRHILEIYRAEEIKDHLRFIDAGDIAEAQRLLGTAIRLFEQAGLQKYLADAYYALGELEMVDPEGAHWDKAERAFEKSLEYGRKSHFLYRVIDTLESLVTLYYFRQGDGDLSEEQVQKLEKYQVELDTYEPGQFPDLFGKYYITLGDVQFDKGLEALRGQGETEAALATLLRAFSYYINAANLAEQFEEQRHYLTLRVFYNRLNTLIHLAQTGDIPSQLVELVERLQPAWERESEYFSMIYRYLMLRIRPEEKLADIRELQTELHVQLDQGEFGLGSLLNDCALVAYRSLIFSKTLTASDKDRYRTQYILSCARQSRIYRALGDEYQAQQYLGFAQHELPYVTDEFWQIELSGYLACSEGTLEYRRGEYGKMLEFYLKEELPVAQGRFERQYPGARQGALSILLDAEKRLQTASEGAAADYQRTRHDRDFGEACYRLGELLMLNGQFEDSPEMPGALTYLKLAVENSKDKSTYFYLNSLQSYATALYFAGDDSQQRKERLEYEQRFLDEYQTARRKYPSLMGRLRITQGDALFSEHFYQQTDPNTKKLRRKYKPRHSTINPRILRIMLRYYVEACNWMAQHSHIDLAGAIRVLQQRIQFISDRESLLIVQQGLGNIWGDQEYLRDKSDELETLIQFARIRSMILADEDNH